MTTHDYRPRIAAPRPSSPPRWKKAALHPTTVSHPATDRAMLWLRRRLGRAVALSNVAALLEPSPGLWLRRDHTLPLCAPACPPLCA
ncbi:hypothetical protein QA942_22740 [Streptomyces sp. B21-106]|uniref:hypothetical protein n=1 Tax=Streptomyces sp. B21-106 TaxID=3039418 RepID=UPI002FF1C4E9